MAGHDDEARRPTSLADALRRARELAAATTGRSGGDEGAELDASLGQLLEPEAAEPVTVDEASAGLARRDLGPAVARAVREAAPSAAPDPAPRRPPVRIDTEIPIDLTDELDEALEAGDDRTVVGSLPRLDDD